MTRTLRTTTKRWGVKLCTSTAIILLCFAFFVYLYCYSSNAEECSWVVIGLVLWPLLMVADLLPLLRNKIVIDDQTVSGRINKERFSLRWNEVVAVWDSTTRSQPCLNIGAIDGGVTIPLKYFDEKLLHDLIRLHVAPEALEKEAIKRMPGYSVWDAENKGVIRQAADESLCVGAKFVRGFGWACGLFFFPLATWFWLDGEGATSLLLLPFVALGMYLILTTGSLEMNKDSITYVTPVSVYRIMWDEVTEIEISETCGSLVLIGKNKRLWAIGPRYWSGKDKVRAFRLLLAQVDTRGVESKQTWKAALRLSKNTKIKQKSQ